MCLSVGLPMNPVALNSSLHVSRVHVVPLYSGLNSAVSEVPLCAKDDVPLCVIKLFQITSSY